MKEAFPTSLHSFLAAKTTHDQRIGEVQSNRDIVQCSNPNTSKFQSLLREIFLDEEASEMLGKSQSTIRRYINLGKLKATKESYSQKYGKKWFRTEFWVIEKKSLDKLSLEEQKRKS